MKQVLPTIKNSLNIMCPCNFEGCQKKKSCCKKYKKKGEHCKKCPKL